MQEFNKIRAYYVQRRSTPKPPPPKFVWNWRRQRFIHISAGWHSAPKGYKDPDRQEVFFSDLSFAKGRPVGGFGKVMLAVDLIK